MPVNIIKRKNAPNAWLEVSCLPEGALPLAGLTCTEDAEDAAASHSRLPAADVWRLNIKAATYKVVANFKQDGNYVNSTKKTSLIPPFKKVNLICS